MLRFTDTPQLICRLYIVSTIPLPCPHALHYLRSTAVVLAEDKAALEAQLQGVLQAEQELTVHLRETHTAIEGQLSTLREQLKVGRREPGGCINGPSPSPAWY